MTALEILKAARELLADESHWYKGWLAARTPNEPVVSPHLHPTPMLYPLDPAATCWCAVGALCKIGGFNSFGERPPVEAVKAIDLLEDSLRDEFGDAFDSIASFNDARETTHAEVVRLFDGAIKLAEENPPAEEQT